MKKNIVFIVGIFISALLSAQITITSSDMPDENDSILVSVNSTIGAADPSLTGVNYNWGFSSLTPATQQYERFDAPSNFTSPFNFFFNPGNTSYGRDNYEFASLSLPGGTQISAAYDFFKETSSQFKQIGAGYTVNGIPIPFFYSKVDIIYEFPMDYLNSDSCDYKYGLNIPGMGYYGQTGHRSNLIDGWGTLTTPFGIFQTLRVRSTIKAVDTIYYSSFGMGTKISRPLKYEFKWLAAGMKIPVLKIDANDIGGLLNVSAVRYIDSMRTEVPQVGIVENGAINPELSVFPNPCVNEIKLKYNLKESTHVKIIISNVIGETAAEVADEIQIAGTHQKSIIIADIRLTPGVYFLNFQTDNYEEIRKIIVTR